MAIILNGNGTITGISAGGLPDGCIIDADITGLAASKLSGALPAISGASLTNLPSGGKILNMQKKVYSSAQTVHSSSYVSIGGGTTMSITVNPASSNSKFLLAFSSTAQMNGTRGMFDIYDGDSYLGADAGASHISSFENGPHKNTMVHMLWVDEPGSTNAKTYNPRCKTDGTHQCYINIDGNVTHFVVMEIAS